MRQDTFTNEDLLAWYQRLDFTERTRRLIDHIRASEPSRRVGGGKRNVSGRYPSEKMGVTIQFESHRVELAGIFEMEHDPDVRQYFDQPEPIKLNYASAKGKRLGIHHTPDFFVIRTSCAGWEEWKTEEELETLSKSNPHRYCKDSSGGWICPPGKELAESLGLYYRVRSSSEINEKYIRNITFLEDYLLESTPSISQEDRASLLRISEGLPGIELLELIRVVESSISRDIVYGAIARGVIYVDLYAALLVEPLRVKVYPSQEFAASHNQSKPRGGKLLSLHSGSCVVWDARTWTVANIGETSVALVSSDQRMTELSLLAFEALIRDHKVSVITTDEATESGGHSPSQLMKASKEHLEIALNRLDEVNTYLRDPTLYEGKQSKRTVQRWVAALRQSDAGHGAGIAGLLPRHSERGNRTSTLAEVTLDKMRNHIEVDYENKNATNKHSSWVRLVEECEKDGIYAPCYSTFCLACNKRPIYEQTRERKGARAAYAFEPVYWRLHQDTPRHGDRPFEIAHIDHTELDVELVSEETGKNFKRPWLTLMTDAFSRRILAAWISFDPPSYRSCMMVMRDCVRRHNRLPQFAVVDNGPEFRSTYFEALLATYKIIKKERPPAKARFGAVIERLFGTVNTVFVHNLRGNTKLTREVRIVTRSVNPRGLAVWTLRELTDRLNQFLFDVYDQLEHPALGGTPRESFLRGMTASGQRLHTIITYDNEFIFSTLPTTPKGTAIMSTGKGIKIHYRYYWSNFFNDPELEGRQVPIRYDPFNAGIAYAFVRTQWVECKSECFALFEGRSEREIKLATEELRRKHQLHSGKRFGVNAKTLGTFFTSVDISEGVLEQRAMDRELHAAMNGIPVVAVMQSHVVPVDQEMHDDSYTIPNDDLDGYDEF